MSTTSTTTMLAIMEQVIEGTGLFLADFIVVGMVVGLMLGALTTLFLILGIWKIR